MKKTFSLFLVLSACLFSQPCFSQQSKIDSLLQVLKTSKEDSNKVNTINQLGRENAFAGNYNESRKYSSDAMLLSEKIKFEKGKIQAYHHTGFTYFYEANYPEAMKQYSSALSIAEKLKDKKGIANSYNNMGLVYTYQQKYSEGMKMHQTALKMYKEINDSTGILNSNNNLGIIYEEQGNYPEALKSYLSALKMAEARGNKKATADAYFNIANIYSGNISDIEGIKNYLLALKIYEEIGFKKGIALCYVNMGQSYEKLDSMESAVKFAQKGYELMEELGLKPSAAQAKNMLAHIHTKLGNYSQAQDDFSASLKLFSEIGDTMNMSVSHRGLGDVYYHKGQYNEALKHFKACLELAKAIDFKVNVKAGYGSIAETYGKMNDYKNAFLNHQLYFAHNDSLLNETRSKQVAEMQTRFETEKKDKDIALLNKDKEIREAEIKKQKLQKYSFIGGLGLVIILLLFGYRAYRTRQALRLQDIRNKISGDLHDDIGSTLNSISVYSEVARKKDEQQDEALEMIGEASRKIIEAMSDIVWTINPENDSFAKIIFRMKSLAYNLFRAKKIEFTFHADEILNEKKLSLEERRNFYLIFKEAINNLVKYSNATRVAITLVNENELIKLRIQDDGVGFDTTQDNIGNGLKNMKRRADEMKAEFKIESSKGNGTQIDLILKA
ncbi:MAG: tetratricopeptide repeat protein [Bacteroidia bacterium]|nr:tetratricopeptide repeat protein [Bacteroidia bacterium]